MPQLSFISEPPPDAAILLRSLRGARRAAAWRRRLAARMPPEHPLYRGRSSAEAQRLRGCLMAAFARTGLPKRALPYVLEALESGQHPYLCAGAARALQGLRRPLPALVPYLLKALEIVRYGDDHLNLDGTGAGGGGSTAAAEILATLRAMGPAAAAARAPLETLAADPHIGGALRNDIRGSLPFLSGGEDGTCCGTPLLQGRRVFLLKGRPGKAVREALLEDQEGRQLAYADFFHGGPALLAFFYTRCDNPHKCSLTITRLGQLREALQDRGLVQVRTAALSYDPVYDLPYRNRSYGTRRGYRFGEGHRLFRALRGQEALTAYFGAGVNYAGSIVNHHTTELYLLDGQGRLRRRFTQLQWDQERVLAAAARLCRRRFPATGRLRDALAPLLSFLLLFVPKCPLCWAAYLSALGVSNLKLARLGPGLLPLLGALLALHLAVLYRGARRRNGYWPFALSAAGALCLLPALWLDSPRSGWAGIVLMLAGALLNSLAPPVFRRLRRRPGPAMARTPEVP